jgi:SAM-dependent methyltransferase
MGRASAFIPRFRKLMSEIRDRWADPRRTTHHYLRLHLQWNAVFVRGRTLDIGGGAKPFIDLFRTDQYVAVGMRPGSNTGDVAATGLKLPFADGVFDSVLCMDVIEHAPEPAGFLAEAARVLRPGAYLLLTVPRAGDRYARPALRGLAETAGLQVVHAYAVTGSWATFARRVFEVLFFPDSRRDFGIRLRRRQRLAAAALPLIDAALSRLRGGPRDSLDNVLVARRPALSAAVPFEPSHHNHFCTYFDQNYLSRALALYHSLEQQCRQPFTLWALCFDEKSYEILARFNLPHLRLIQQANFEAGDTVLAQAKADRSRTEYFWTCTPSLILYIFRHNPDLSALTYIDSDLYFFADPQPIFDEVARASVLLVEHRFGPALLERLYYGLFNVGLLVFRLDANSLGCLTWWRERCLEWCRSVPEGDRFGDQKYLNRWPSDFPGVAVAGRPGIGVAPWNIMNYEVSASGDKLLIDGQPIIFYHFHNFRLINAHLCDPGLDNYGARLTASVRRMYCVYGRAVLASWQMARQADPDFPPGFAGDGRLQYHQSFIRRQLVSLD